MAFRTSALFPKTGSMVSLAMGRTSLASSRQFTNTGGASFAAPGGNFGEKEIRTYTGYNIYKGKAAINIKPIPPTFRVTKSSRVLEREGVLLWEFAPASGQREYNWNAKISFAMDVTECGELLAMDRTKSIEFLHDPGMGGADSGKITKKVRIQPTQDTKGVFVSVSHTDKVQNIANSYSVPMTWAELEVVRSAAQFCLPRFLGLDKVFEETLEAPSHTGAGAFQGFADPNSGVAAHSPSWT